MKTETPNLPSFATPDEQLRSALHVVAKRLRLTQSLEIRIRIFAWATPICAVLAALGFLIPDVSTASFIIAAATLIVAFGYAWRASRSLRLDYAAAAKVIEAENPDLGQMLSTAVQQADADPSHFFTQRLIATALQTGKGTHWNSAGKAKRKRSGILYVSLLLVSMLLVFAARRSSVRTIQIAAEKERIGITAVDAVLPGNISVERGSSLVVTVRFDGEVPATTQLVTLTNQGETQSFPMAQSLSDPVFAFNLARIQKNQRYWIQYGAEQSQPYRIDVFDLPVLTQSDAELDYPDYTGWTDRTIEDTRRITAIEGTLLRYTFRVNKPLQRAYLSGPDDAELDLKAVNDEGTLFAYDATLSASQRFRLHLIDTEQRQNRVPTDIRIEVLPNERPTLRFVAPRGDQRLSPIEEVLLQGTASDDFGLLDFGLSYTVDQGNPIETSLASSAESAEAITSADLEQWIRFEALELVPGSLVSWYLWADDIGPSGTSRRTASDLFFAEIRPLDEIFREQDGGGSSGEQQGNAGGLEDLVAQQRQMSIALFRIQHDASDPTAARDDLQALQVSQQQIEDQLSQIAPRITEASTRQKAQQARDFMEATIESLDTTIDGKTLDPLSDAWTASQGALKNLISMAESEYAVSRNQRGSGGGSNSRNQSQLDQLRMRQDENRYETATEAQPLSSEQDRAEMQLLSRLNELSRRQQDVNDQLQELQSALANAATEEEKERIERELKRLEEEQRQMMADVDEALQNTPNSERAREARRQMEQSRESMRQAGEQLAKGEVSQALASGTRARDGLDETREQMRNRASSQFAEAMRQARREAQEIAEKQKAATKQLEEMVTESARRLDNSERGEAVASQLDSVSKSVADLMENLRTVVEDSEDSEPGLHRKLYDIMREQNGSGIEEQLAQDSELLQRGFPPQALENQEELAADLERLASAVGKAAESILGDDASTLRFAQNELDTLSEQLSKERSQETQSSGESNPSEGSQAQASSGNGGGDASPGRSQLDSLLNNALNSLPSPSQGTLTGNGFGEWAERLRTIEELMEDGDMRQRLSQAREVAESTRQEFKRHGESPQWEMVEAGIIEPLNEVRYWIRQELSKREDSEALQPIDRDPVPQEYSEAVQSYYETLGEE